MGFADPVIDRVRVERLDENVAGPWEAGDSQFAVIVESGRVAGVFAPVDELPAALVATRLGQSALHHPVADHDGLLRRLLAELGPHAAGLGRWAVGALDCAVWDLHGHLAPGVARPPPGRIPRQGQRSRSHPLLVGSGPRPMVFRVGPEALVELLNYRFRALALGNQKSELLELLGGEPGGGTSTPT